MKWQAIRTLRQLEDYSGYAFKALRCTSDGGVLCAVRSLARPITRPTPWDIVRIAPNGELEQVGQRLPSGEFVWDGERAKNAA